MSRAFVKEDDGPGAVAPIFGAALPAGTPNLATPWSAAALRRRLADARATREALADAQDGLAQARRAEADALIRVLEPYLATLQVTAPPAAPSRVGFGVEVTLDDGRVFAIVGVDEADPALGRVSFLSPLARALHGAAVGDSVALRTPRGEDQLEVVALRPARPLP